MLRFTVNDSMLSAIGQVLAIGDSEAITFWGHGKDLILYSELQDVFKLVQIKSDDNEDFCLRLPTESIRTLFVRGIVQMEIDENSIVMYRVESDKITCKCLIPHEISVDENRIRIVMEYVTHTQLETFEDLDWIHRINSVVRFKDKSENPIKGLAVKDGYAYVMSTGFYVYKPLVYSGSILFTTNGLMQLIRFTRDVSKCEIGRVQGYNICVLGSAILGWRRARVEVDLPLEDISKIDIQLEGKIHLASLVDVIKILKSVKYVELDLENECIHFETVRGSYNLSMDGKFSPPKIGHGSEDSEDYSEERLEYQRQKVLKEYGHIRMDYKLLSQVVLSCGRGLCKVAITESFIRMELQSGIVILMGRR